jgi:hypothetical protein
MILFVNKVKIKWEHHNCIEKNEKKNDSQFLANKISNGKNKKKTILKNKKKKLTWVYLSQHVKSITWS